MRFFKKFVAAALLVLITPSPLWAAPCDTEIGELRKMANKDGAHMDRKYRTNVENCIVDAIHAAYSSKYRSSWLKDTCRNSSFDESLFVNHRDAYMADIPPFFHNQVNNFFKVLKAGHVDQDTRVSENVRDFRKLIAVFIDSAKRKAETDSSNLCAENSFTKSFDNIMDSLRKSVGSEDEPQSGAESAAD